MCESPIDGDGWCVVVWGQCACSVTPEFLCKQEERFPCERDGRGCSGRLWSPVPWAPLQLHAGALQWGLGILSGCVIVFLLQGKGELCREDWLEQVCAFPSGGNEGGERGGA